MTVELMSVYYTGLEGTFHTEGTGYSKVSHLEGEWLLQGTGGKKAHEPEVQSGDAGVGQTMQEYGSFESNRKTFVVL